jgi:branched-chain amino acid aminotransferase
MHRHLLHNGGIYKTDEKLLSPGQVGLLNGWGVFSTIRVFDGLLFAYERHWARMKRDAALLHVPFPDDPEAVRRDLLALVEANGARNATLRVAVIRNRGGFFEGAGIERDYDLVAFTTDVHEWGRSVRLAIQPQARHAACMFAGTKMLSWSFNLTWLENARQRGFDEVILLNEHGKVSECTSANIFIATAEGVFTPPLSSGCLPGITRELLLSEAQADGFPVIERDLELDDLYRADSVFITSTTRELLAVAEIEGRTLNQRSPAREAMQAAFSRYVDQYVAEALRKADVPGLAGGVRSAT